MSQQLIRRASGEGLLLVDSSVTLISVKWILKAFVVTGVTLFILKRHVQNLFHAYYIESIFLGLNLFLKSKTIGLRLRYFSSSFMRWGKAKIEISEVQG